MNIEERLKQIEATLAAVGKLGASYMGERAYGQLSRSEESLAAIREQLAAQDDLVREHYRAYEAQIAGLEKERDEVLQWRTSYRSLLGRWNLAAANAGIAGSEYVDYPERVFDRVNEARGGLMRALLMAKKQIAALEAAAKERDAFMLTLEVERDRWKVAYAEEYQRSATERDARVEALTSAIEEYRYYFGACTRDLSQESESRAAAAGDRLEAALSPAEPTPPAPAASGTP